MSVDRVREVEGGLREGVEVEGGRDVVIRWVWL